MKADPCRSATAIGHLLEVPFDLHTYRRHLPCGGLPFVPWDGRAPARVAGYRHMRENRTPRIPEPIMAPLLFWSLRYVDAFAADIFAVRAELDRLEAHRDALRAQDAGLDLQTRRALHRARLADLLDRRRSERRGVPIWGTAHNDVLRRDPRTGRVTPPVNAHLLHLHLGIDAVAEPASHVGLNAGARPLLDTAMAALGPETGGMDTPVAPVREDGAPWHPRFDAKSRALEERMLQAACYVVCAYLTGMRDCEVQAMRRGCLSLTRIENGLVMRHRVRSTVHKTRTVRGTPEDWVTITPVAEAIAVLERLSARAANASGLDTLWPVLARKGNTKSHLSAEVVRQLNVNRERLDALSSTAERPAIPPGPGGGPWRLTTRQFRRTVAWHIANQPFGTIAGTIQYKRASVAAFEGYAGASAFGFRAEVDAQRRLGQQGDILAYFDRRRAGAVPSGPAGPRIAGALDAAVRTLGPLPAMVADRARLRRLLVDLARTLHIGVLADCFFDPATALYLKQAGTSERAEPLGALCQPTRCPDACLTERHRPAWARTADDARTLPREKRPPELQRVPLRQDVVRIEAVLDGIVGPAET